MTLTLEFDPQTEKLLLESAAAAGTSPAEFAAAALRERLSSEWTADNETDSLSETERARRLDEIVQRISRSNGSLGRNGRPWRELLHEGHKY